MTEQIKYQSITRFGHKTTQGMFNENSFIVIEEKIDGANASFRVDGEGNLRVFSRNLELGEGNTLSGFYGWAMENINPKELSPNHIYFGEWNIPHTVKYPENTLHQFYMFDLFNVKTMQYERFTKTLAESKRLHINHVPIFYTGKFISFEHLMSFVGKTMLGGEQGKGIVVKDVDYVNQFGRQQFVKLVCDEFREVVSQKAPKDPDKIGEEVKFINECITDARINKTIHKLIDENVIAKDFEIEDMSTVLKAVNGVLFEDVMKEESENLPQDYDVKLIRKTISKKSATIVKKFITDRGIEG